MREQRAQTRKSGDSCQQFSSRSNPCMVRTETLTLQLTKGVIPTTNYYISKEGRCSRKETINSQEVLPATLWRSPRASLGYQSATRRHKRLVQRRRQSATKRRCAGRSSTTEPRLSRHAGERKVAKANKIRYRQQ